MRVRCVGRSESLMAREQMLVVTENYRPHGLLFGAAGGEAS